MMSLGAGMSTGIGAAFILCTTSINPTLLACTMAFSSGVMLYVSLVEVIGVANEHLAKQHSAAEAYALATLAFFAGRAPPPLPPTSHLPPHPRLGTHHAYPLPTPPPLSRGAHHAYPPLP